MFVVEGTKMLDELLTSGFDLYAIYALESYLPSLQISGKLPENIKIVAVTESELQKISAQRSPNKVLAVAFLPQETLAAFPGHTAAGIEATAREQATGDDSKGTLPAAGFWLALDTIQDPGNMGTIIRIADWFGMAGIIASEDSAAFYSPKVVQASMGSVFRVRLRQGNLAGILPALNIPVYGALLNGRSIYQQSFEGEGILLLGNESKGIAPGLRKYISHPVGIPRFGAAESLNVATAAAVICSEVKRKAVSVSKSRE